MRGHLRFKTILFLAFLSLFAGIQALDAGKDLKTEVLDHYKKAVALAEENHIYQDDAFNIAPKIKLANQSLLRGDLAQAEHVLEEILSDFEALREAHQKGIRTDLKVEWLETYVDIFQRFAVLALLAYFLVNLTFFKALLTKNKFSLAGKVLLSILTLFCAVVLGIFDLSRYGDSVWTFFDVQSVLIAVAGLLGGFGVSLMTTIGVLGFRWLLQPVFAPSLSVVLWAGLLGGLFHQQLKSVQSSARRGLICGILIGVLHGIIIYIPLRTFFTIPYLVFGILFLALLEGGAVALMMGVIGGILREETRRTLQNDLLTTKLLVLQTQLNPHFLFNAFNSIAQIFKNHDFEAAERMVLKLSDYFRQNLQRKSEKVSLKDEMDLVDNYLEIEKARFQEKLRIEKDFCVPDTLWAYEIPILVVQPLVENAIKHGIRKKVEGGTIHLALSERAGDLVITVSDDGAGKNPAYFKRLLLDPETPVEGLGVGVRNIHQRLLRHYGDGYGLNFETQPDKGTRVVVRIPIKGEKEK